MKRTYIVQISMLVALTGTGCVSKDQFQSVQTELAACQAEKAQAEAQVITWEQRFDREAQHWKSIGASVTEQVPQALTELNSERDRIVKLIPEQVKDEVEGYLDEYFATVMRGFDTLAADNRDVQIQLSATQKVLESLGSDTRAVSAKIDTTLEDERTKREKEARKRQAVASQITEVVAMVTEFNNTRINCKQCPDKLKLNRKQREAMTAFHGDLTSQLAQIQSFAEADYEMTTEDVPAAPLEETSEPTPEEEGP